MQKKKINRPPTRCVRRSLKNFLNLPVDFFFFFADVFDLLVFKRFFFAIECRFSLLRVNLQIYDCAGSITAKAAPYFNSPLLNAI